MIDFSFDSRTEQFKDYFNLIIRFFLDRMIEKRIFLSKLNFLRCEVRVVDDDGSADIVGGHVDYLIRINVGSNDTVPKVLFMFAHEIAHLILMPMTGNPYSDFNRSDKSFAVTTLTRKVDDVLYGTAFEEIFCNFLALEAVNSLPSVEYRPSLVLLGLIQLCKSVVSAFDLCDSGYTKWDEYLEDDSSQPKNTFMFGIVNGDISLAIYRFDKALGDGSWKRLMKDIYTVTQQGNNIEEVLQKIYGQLEFFQEENKRLVRPRIA